MMMHTHECTCFSKFKFIYVVKLRIIFSTVVKKFHFNENTMIERVFFPVQPVQTGYRNKCEFTIGQDIDKNGG